MKTIESIKQNKELIIENHLQRTICGGCIVVVSDIPS